MKETVNKLQNDIKEFGFYLWSLDAERLKKYYGIETFNELIKYLYIKYTTHFGIKI